MAEKIRLLTADTFRRARSLWARAMGAVLVLTLLIAQTAYADSYTYNVSWGPMDAPDAAVVHTVVEADNPIWGGQTLNAPSDLAVAPDGDLYVADTGNSRIVVLSSDLSFKRQIAEVTMPDGTVSALVEPHGVFVDGNDVLYIADTGNGRILACDTDNDSVMKQFLVTGEDVYDDTFVFKPLKVTADDQGNTYAVSEGGYDGLLQFDSRGRFMGYLGANGVSLSPWDWFWKKVSTQVQRQKMAKTLPLEFDNLDVDADGFVYTVTANAASNPVRKQNTLGRDILKSSSLYGRPMGDYNYIGGSQVTLSGPSTLMDISVQSWGYLCLDQKRGRVFAYGDMGEILFIVGGYGAESGKFMRPSAVDAYQDHIYVLDERMSSLTEFKLTDYGSKLLMARQQYMDGDYEGSEQSWNEVLRYQSQLPIAHVGIGKTYYMRGNYTEALKYAKMGSDKDTYSEAYEKYQQELLPRALSYIAIFLVVVAAAVIAVKLYRRRHPKKGARRPLPDWLKGLAYSWHISLHPFDGFWDMTHEGRGKLSSACILYGIWILTCLISDAFTGFLFKPIGGQFNLIMSLCTAVLPVFLWCVCNWAVATLMDGDGTPRAIAMSTAYALAPLIVSKLASVLLSNVLTLDQGMILTVIGGIGTVWFVMLLMASVITVHNYTLTRTLAVTVIIIGAMGTVIFLGILLLNLVDQMRYSLLNLYREIVINM